MTASENRSGAYLKYVSTGSGGSLEGQPHLIISISYRDASVSDFSSPDR
jgi:hypothetical protein